MDINLTNSTTIEVSASNIAPSVAQLNVHQHTQVVEVKVDADAAQLAQEAVIRAENVLNQTVNLISGIDNRNTILFDAGFLKTVDDFTALANTRWNIGGVDFSNPNNIQFPIALSATGKQRWVRFYLNRNNEVVLLNGEEREENPPLPVLPDNTLNYTFFIVTDSVIQDVTPPIVGEHYKQKIESGFIHLYNAGSLSNLAINDHRRHFILHNATDLHSLSFGIESGVYPGQMVSFVNKKNVPIPFFHLSTYINAGNVKFEFPDYKDYYLMPNEIVEFHLNDTVDRLIFLSSNMSKLKSNNIILSDLNIDGAIFTQGVTGTVVLKSYLIPLNKINKNGILKINLRMSKPEGVEATFTSSLNFGTSINQFPLNSMYSQAAGNKFVSGIRNVKSIYNASTNTCLMTSFTSSGGYYTDYISHASVPPSKSINLTSEGLRVFLIVNTTSLMDKIVLDYLTIEFLEV